MTQDEKYMQRCLELAENALGKTYPNPVVGSVVVYNNHIIGEGYHLHSGQPHAEVMAINSVRNKELLHKSTLYVNLEPCSHYGKTPPCADLIVSKQIPRVVVGTVDTSSKVSGRGIARMRSAGVDVTVGVLEGKARWINRRFFTFHEKKRPYIILKWAQTADGYIDIKREVQKRQPTPVTSQVAHTLVHRWRSEEQTILVGTNTVLKDNPRLNVRYWHGKSPLRVCIDIKNRIPKDSNIFDDSTQTICLRDSKFYNTEIIAQKLYEMNVQSVIVEGGTKLISSFITSDLWDESRIFIANLLFLEGLEAPKISGSLLSSQYLSNERLYIFTHEKNSGLIHN